MAQPFHSFLRRGLGGTLLSSYPRTELFHHSEWVFVTNSIPLLSGMEPASFRFRRIGSVSDPSSGPPPSGVGEVLHGQCLLVWYVGFCHLWLALPFTGNVASSVEGSYSVIPGGWFRIGSSALPKPEHRSRQGDISGSLVILRDLRKGKERRQIVDLTQEKALLRICPHK